MNTPIDIPMWAFAWGGPVGRCIFRQNYADFLVEEILPFEPDGCGEHCFLLIEKQGENTDWVSGLLAQYAGVKRQSVSYAGRKDRRGRTRQWFSVWLPGRETPDWNAFTHEGVKVLTVQRHSKKLRTGALKGNRFAITLRDIEASREEVDARLKVIKQLGVPNYFGEQRFGRNGANLAKAERLFSDDCRVPRNKRSMYLSAARSYLFNQIVSARVMKSDWMSYIPGDVPGFQDNSSLILRDHDQALQQRIEQGEVMLTAPLWGSGELLSDGECQSLERRAVEQYPLLLEGLEREWLRQERRAIRLIPYGMEWVWGESVLQIAFSLPKGCFATSVLREVLNCQEGVAHENSVK